jgi:hypothetical protein
MGRQSFQRLALAIAVVSSHFAIAAPIQAVQFAGKTYFEQPPRLLGAAVTHNATYFPGAIYSFTLTVPEQAGEALGSIVIRPETSADRIRFDLETVQAYVGSGHRGERLPVQATLSDPQADGIIVTFDPPVAPGKALTVDLRARRNPSVGGVYLYGVTAFPAGPQPYGQFLGFGRIHIYDSIHDSRRLLRGPFGW